MKNCGEKVLKRRIFGFFKSELYNVVCISHTELQLIKRHYTFLQITLYSKKK